jgi:hypothetical protein
MDVYVLRQAGDEQMPLGGFSSPESAVGWLAARYQTVYCKADTAVVWSIVCVDAARKEHNFAINLFRLDDK